MNEDRLMTGIEIDLSEPFESFLTTVLSLPNHGVYANGSSNEEEIKQATRCLYEAAHGRLVETSIGPIPIAPAVAASLRAEPFSVNSRDEFLRLAETKSGFRPGAPAVVDPWPQYHERRALNRWENEGGRTQAHLVPHVTRPIQTETFFTTSPQTQTT